MVKRTHTHIPAGNTHTYIPAGNTHTHTPAGNTHTHTPAGNTHTHTPAGNTHTHTPAGHLGGMVSGGLGWTDGHPSGGIAAEFFTRVGGRHFAPSAAEAVFNALVNETGSLVKVLHHCMVSTVHKSAATLTALTTTSGGKVRARARASTYTHTPMHPYTHAPINT